MADFLAAARYFDRCYQQTAASRHLAQAHGGRSYDAASLDGRAAAYAEAAALLRSWAGAGRVSDPPRLREVERAALIRAGADRAELVAPTPETPHA